MTWTDFFTRWRSGWRPWSDPSRVVSQPNLIGCEKSAEDGPLDRLYARMRVGDPSALAQAAELARRDTAGTASAAEKSALWGLRALHEEPSEPSDEATARCTALLERARSANSLAMAEPMFGARLPHGRHASYVPSYVHPNAALSRASFSRF